VLIEHVERSGWAEIGGMRAGDIVLEVGGKPTPDLKSLQKILKQARTDRSARLVFKVQRDPATQFLELTPSWD
jgi:S1-C subfamily serine protease